MKFFNICLSLFILLSIFTIGRTQDCEYTIQVRTGDIRDAGTSSRINLTLSNASGSAISIPNLRSWGHMGPSQSYFWRGNLDVFRGRSRCLTGPVCAMTLRSDGTGAGSGWYVDYVEVTTIGISRQCAQITFTVQQWLARPPYQLFATRNYCSSVHKNRAIEGQELPKIYAV